MSKLSAYTYYQNTTSATAPLTTAAKTPAAPGAAPAATIEVSDAARQALAQQAQRASLQSTNTIWGSGPRN